MLACMNIQRHTQLQWTLLETEQSEIRFITTSIFPEVWKISYNSKYELCVDVDNKVDIIYTVCVIERRKSLKRKPQKGGTDSVKSVWNIVWRKSSIWEWSTDDVIVWTEVPTYSRIPESWRRRYRCDWNLRVISVVTLCERTSSVNNS